MVLFDCIFEVVLCECVCGFELVGCVCVVCGFFGYFVCVELGGCVGV